MWSWAEAGKAGQAIYIHVFAVSHNVYAALMDVQAPIAISASVRMAGSKQDIEAFSRWTVQTPDFGSVHV